MLTSPICVIDTETTGLQPYYHEVCEICILPLNMDFTINETVDPFVTDVKPDHFDHIEQEALDVNGKTREELEASPSRIETIKAFMAWFNDVGFGTGKFKTVAPLAQNVAFDKTFLMAWLDPKNKQPNALGSYLHYRWRDTMTTAQFLNDKSFTHKGRGMFFSVALKQLAKKLNIVNPAPHTATGDAATCAEVYRILTS